MKVWTTENDLQFEDQEQRYKYIDLHNYGNGTLKLKAKYLLYQSFIIDRIRINIVWL